MVEQQFPAIDPITCDWFTLACSETQLTEHTKCSELARLHVKFHGQDAGVLVCVAHAKVAFEHALQQHLEPYGIFEEFHMVELPVPHDPSVTYLFAGDQ